MVMMIRNSRPCYPKKKKKDSKMKSALQNNQVIAHFSDSPLFGFPASGISKVYCSIYPFVNIVI